MLDNTFLTDIHPLYAIYVRPIRIEEHPRDVEFHLSHRRRIPNVLGAQGNLFPELDGLGGSLGHGCQIRRRRLWRKGAAIV